MMNVVVVIPTYKRPFALKRLLNSLKKASYPSDVSVTLIISIEGQSDPGVIEISEAFEWHAEKKVIKHLSRLGLRNHIISCGDLVERYDAIVVLEEDLVVSPYYFEYVLQVLDFYESNVSLIASFSLYSFAINEYASLPFQSIDDGFDNYFVQTCSSWGQVWTRSQWMLFKVWYENNKNIQVSKVEGLPAQVMAWPDSSWKKYFNTYMVENSLYSVVPRVSLSTNFGDAGEHHIGSDKYQVSLLNFRKEWKFSNLQESHAVYDSFFEPILQFMLSDLDDVCSKDITCDLYGLKEGLVETAYVLTSRTAEEKSVVLAKYGNKMQPDILNAIYKVKGENFSLIKLNKSKVLNTLPYNSEAQIARSVSFLTKRQLISYIYWLVKKFLLKR